MPIVNIHWSFQDSTDEQRRELAVRVAEGISRYAHVDPKRVMVFFQDTEQPAGTGPVTFINWSAGHDNEERQNVCHALHEAVQAITDVPYSCPIVFYDIPKGCLGGGGRLIV